MKGLLHELALAGAMVLIGVLAEVAVRVWRGTSRTGLSVRDSTL